MNRIKVEDLKEGMIFDKTVFIEDNMVFIPPNIPVRKSDIDKLIKWGVHEVETEGQPKTGLEKYVKASEMWGVVVETRLIEFYKKMLLEYDSFLEALKKENIDDPLLIQNMAEKIQNYTKGKYIDFLRLVLSNSVKMESLIKDSIDCAIIAIAIGYALQLDDERIKRLIMAALVHDLGMLKISKAIVTKTDKLNSEELKQIKSHPLYSYQEISKILHLPEEIAQIALQHHERWDGEGYPQGLKGEEILYEARIISVADAFRAMINVRPYRDSMVGYDAIKNILSDNSRRFDPEILKAFIRHVGIYPIGSLVILNDSTICRVIEINNTAPLRPRVKVLIDSDGNEHRDDSGRLIDLIEEKSLFITRAINIEELLNPEARK